MSTPASREFNATKESAPFTPITANGGSPAFRIKTKDEIRGGFEPLEGTLAVVGDLDSGTATLQIKVGGVWHNTTYVLSGGVTAIILGPETGPRASEYRFLVAGAGGSLAASFFIAARSPLEFV